jgi:hypothetical protein
MYDVLTVYSGYSRYVHDVSATFMHTSWMLVHAHNLDVIHYGIAEILDGIGRLPFSLRHCLRFCVWFLSEVHNPFDYGIVHTRNRASWNIPCRTGTVVVTGCFKNRFYYRSNYECFYFLLRLQQQHLPRKPSQLQTQ